MPLRLLGLLVGAALVCMLAGCRKMPSFFEGPRPTPPASTTPPSTPPAVNREKEAVTTVTDYLTALQAHDYTKAYDMLSGDSQSTHTRKTFEEQGQQGMPLYDLGTAQATVTGDTAVVAVRQTEDPATHGFHLVREDESWRIVYRGGRPSQPYAE